MTQTIVSLQPTPLTVLNEDFLRGVFGTEWERAHITGFPDDPKHTDPNILRPFWKGKEARLLLGSLKLQWNNFFTISLFHTCPEQNISRRKKALYDKTYCIVLDDVGLRGLEGTSAKVDPSKVMLKPSWALETSPGNWQLGYILEGGDARGGKVNALLDALVASGLVSDGSDPGMKGVTRYVRMPEGRNTKKEYGAHGHKHVMGSWNPNRTYKLEDIADAYGVRSAFDAAPDEIDRPTVGSFDADGDWLAEALNAAGKVHSYNQTEKKWDVECPFIDDHSQRADSGCAYLGVGRWYCWHGHCQDRTHDEFTEKFQKDHPKECREAQWGGLGTLGDEAVAPSSVREELEDLFGTEAVEAKEVERELGPFQKRMAENSLKSGGLAKFNPLLDQKALLKGMVPEQGMGVLYGDTGIGKSFVSMDLMLRMAQGWSWHGHRTKAPEGDWIYVSSEGGMHELKKRLAGWCAGNGVGDIPGNVEFLTVSMSWGVEEGALDAERFLKWCRGRGRPVRMVVVDTLNRNMAGDESSTRDMTGFVDCVEKVWRGLGCSVLVVHHEGKDQSKGARGSSVLKGAAEYQWRVFRGDAGMGGGIFIEKNRHGQDGMTYGFGLKTHDFGKDSDGDDVSTLYVAKAQAPTTLNPSSMNRTEKALADEYERMVNPGEWCSVEDLLDSFMQDVKAGKIAGIKKPQPKSKYRAILNKDFPKYGWEVAPDGDKLSLKSPEEPEF